MPRLLTTLPPADPDRQEIRVFLKVRNEAVRLPHVLAYYRALGADRFVIVDNASSDDTVGLLAAQPDVHLFTAEGSFRAAGGGQAWLDRLLDEHGAGRWCLVVDADELLFYPGIEKPGVAFRGARFPLASSSWGGTAPLRTLCDALDLEGAEALCCMMLDMYGAGPVRATPYSPGEPFLAACPWFDPAPYWRAGPHGDCPHFEIYGGVRQRVFYPRWQAPDLALRASERLYNLANRLTPIRRNAWIQSWREPRPPNLAKVPLVRWQRGFRYLATTHRISPVRLSEGSGLLLHFKFLGDLGERVAAEVCLAWALDWR